MNRDEGAPIAYVSWTVKACAIMSDAVLETFQI
jgi:hypothetical protein